MESAKRIYMRLHIALLMAVLLLQSCGPSNHNQDPGVNARLEQMRREATTAAAMQDFDRSDSIGRALYQLAETYGNEVYMAYGLMCQAFFKYTSEGAEKRLESVKKAERLALETGNDSLLARIYNTLGTYSVAYTHDFEESKRNFSEAIRYARKAGAPDFAIASECNLSELYRRRRDTLGIRYDLDIYRYADEVQNRDLLLSAAQHCAEYYLKFPEKASRAIPYIERIREEGDTQQFHVLHANYLFAIGSFEEAEREYRQYMDFSKEEPTIYLNYGQLLNKTGKYAQSIEMLKRAHAAYDRRDPYNSTKINILQLIAENNDRLGNHKEAYTYLQRYFSERDSIDEARKGEDLQRFKVKFEVEKKELELEHEKESNDLKNILIAIVLFALVLTVGGFIFYIRRRDRLHRIIVASHLESLQILKEEKADTDGASTLSDTDTASEAAQSDLQNLTPPSETQNGLSAKKRNEIWKAIMTEVDQNRIHTDPQLSRETFAEKVGCNHTWFSQVIKAKTGKSYTQFINSLRVEESLRLLSTPGNDITQREVAAKSGFMSPSSFYSAFRQQVGMSPTEYKRQVENLENCPKVS